MAYYESIMTAVNYIENHLDKELTNGTCAKVCGYSEYHFIRIFQGVTGYSPKDYIRKRRLSRAAKMLVQTRLGLMDIALDVGFNSVEHFIRSFKQEHGVTPGVFRKANSSLLLTEPFSRRCLDFENMSVEIVQLSAMTLCCHSFRINRKEVPTCWNRYHGNAIYQSINPDVEKSSRIDYGMLMKVDSNYHYAIGLQVPSEYDCPVGLVKIAIPSQKYAIFHTPKADAFTFVETIRKTWAYAYDHWLPENAFEPNGNDPFESYCEASRTFSQEIYIPIRG